jgi:hypothetical protein
MMPFGFFEKYQWIDVKGKKAAIVARELVCVLLRKPKFRTRLLISIGRALADLDSDSRITSLRTIDSWGVATDDELRALLETIPLSHEEKSSLEPMITRVQAFHAPKTKASDLDDIPF